MTTLGITGGGHLAKMLAQAAGILGIETVIFSHEAHSPAAQVSPRVLTGSANDDTLLKQLAEQCDVIALESGDFSLDSVRKLENFGAKVFPPSKVLEQVQDRVLQLRTMQAAGLDVPRFRPVQTATDVMASVEEFGFPLMLKARHGGASSITIRRSPEVPGALGKLQGSDLYAEEFVPFVRELSVTVARGRGGELQFYPVVEFVYQQGICNTVRCPAPIEEATAYNATEIAKRAVEAINGVGVFGVEIFEQEDNQLKFHRILPQPHDAGVYSIEGTMTSQFTNHLRAIFGMPLGDVYQIAPATVSLALQAAQPSTLTLESFRDLLATGGTQLHLYRTGAVANGQVAGHVTILGYETDGAEKVGLLAISRIHW